MRARQKLGCRHLQPGRANHNHLAILTRFLRDSSVPNANQARWSVPEPGYTRRNYDRRQLSYKPHSHPQNSTRGSRPWTPRIQNPRTQNPETLLPGTPKTEVDEAVARDVP